MKKVIFLIVLAVFTIVGISVSSGYPIEGHDISMFKEADDCGNIISKDDNVILLYPFPVESDIPPWEEGVCGWIEGTAHDAITLEYPVIGISIPSPGEIVSKPEVRATLRSTSAYTDPIPEGLSKIKATSIRVKFIDEEKNEFEGRSLLYPDEDSSCIRIISSAPYDLPNGVYTVEVYCENTNGQSAKEVCKFVLMRPYSSTSIWPLWEIEYDAYSFQRECPLIDELIGETWGKYSGDQGSDPLDMNYYELIGQSGYVRWSGYDEEKDVYLNCEVEIRGSYAFGDYSLKSKKYYRKAKLEINIDRRPCTSPGQVLCKYHRLGNNQCSDAEFNPFYLEVYIDGVKAGEKLMEKTDVCCETCIIDIPLDIDTVKAGENINVELKTNRLQKVNPITGDQGEYIEEIEVLSTGTHFGTHSGVHLILYEPEAEVIEEPPEEEEEPISGSFETMQYIFSEPKTLSKLCISSSLASVGDWFPVNSPSKITITPYIVEDVTTEYLTWRELETYIFTEPTESPCCVDLHENTNASGVKYAVTIVSDSDYPPELYGISIIEIVVPDLVVANINAPDQASSQEQIEVSWTVLNEDNGKAEECYDGCEWGWKDKLYLSTDLQLDNSDVFLADHYHELLYPGGSYTVTKIVKLPEWSSGTYYLLVKTDAGDEIYESNEENNVLAVPIKIVPHEPIANFTYSIGAIVKNPASIFWGKKVDSGWFFTYTSSGAVYTFDASSSYDPDNVADEDNGIVEYYWEVRGPFGNPPGIITGADKYLIVNFPREGDYTADLFVWDKDELVGHTTQYITIDFPKVIPCRSSVAGLYSQSSYESLYGAGTAALPPGREIFYEYKGELLIAPRELMPSCQYNGVYAVKNNPPWRKAYMYNFEYDKNIWESGKEYALSLPDVSIIGEFDEWSIENGKIVFKGAEGFVKDVVIKFLEQQVSSIKEDSINQGEKDIHYAQIDSSVKEAVFSLLWSGSNLDLTLCTPTGEKIDPIVAEGNLDINFVESDRYEYYFVKNPESGKWKIEVLGVDVPDNGEGYIAVIGLTTDLELIVSTVKRIYESGDQVVIKAPLTKSGLPFTGALLNAEIKEPDGSIENFILYDDGTHGDENVNDGIYTATYTNTLEIGTYGITASASGTIEVEKFERTAFTSFSIVGQHQPPIADANGPYAGIEGQAIIFNASASYDPDPGDSIASFEWDFNNDGATDATGIEATWTWNDDHAGQVNLTVTDSHGESSTDTTSVTILNAPPEVEAGNDQTVNEGDTVSFIGDFTDPGTGDTHTIEWDFGDGTPGSTGTLEPTHVYSDNGTYTVTFRVTDDDGASTSDTLNVTVANIAPIVDAGVDQIADEGDIMNFAGSFTDPGTADTHLIEWDFGDGTPGSTGTLEPTHVYADNGTYTVTLTVTDDDGASTLDTLIVTINNVAPVLDECADQTVQWGDTMTFSRSFTDPGDDSWTAVIDWGDDSQGEGILSSKIITATHVYSILGEYICTLTVLDDDGGVGSGDMQITVTTRATELEYIGDLSAQYSDYINLKAQLNDPENNNPLPDKSINFVLGTQTATATTGPDGIATTSFKLDQPAGSYDIKAEFAGDDSYSPDSDTKAMQISREDVKITYTGDTILPTTAGSIDLRATLEEIDTDYGDLTKINVNFTIYKSNDLSYSNPIATIPSIASIPVTSSGMGVGTATASIDNLPEDDYMIIARIVPNDYYQSISSNPTPMIVYEPTDQFTTGGGWIWDPTGSHGNFGFNVKYNKKGKVQGNSIYVYRLDGLDYIVKSNAWIGLAINDNTSTFQGKAVLQIFDPVTGELQPESSGNFQFTVEAMDNELNDDPDNYKITVLDKEGLEYHNATGSLEGGNIVIHDKKSK